MALNKNVMMADTGGSEKKKTGQSGVLIIPTSTANGGGTTHTSSSGRDHGGSNGTFGTPSLNKDTGATKAGDMAKNNGAAKTNNTTTTATTGGGGGGSVSTTSAPAASAPNYDTTVPSVFGDTVDPELLAQYQNAMAALEAMKGQAPTYGSQYDAQIQSLYQQIIGRGPFKYDSKTDPLYQQYVQDYTQQGKMAMRDTMGQAAALTGGYGSSYAQSVGQQQYDQYLQRMADILPETYGMALNAYNAQGDQLNQQLATTTDLERSDYNRYLDQLNQHNIDVQRAQTDADTWYDRMVAAEKQAYNRQLDQYDMQKDNYNRLINLIAVGYSPSKEEYNAAGLSEAQGAALKSAYAPASASSAPVVHRIPQNQTAQQSSDADANFENLLMSALGGSTSAKKSGTGTAKGTGSNAATAVQAAVNKIKQQLK